MKLCIPVATPDGLAAALEADFGAAQHLLILDSDSEVFHAIDRAQPEAISEEIVSGIQGILCSEIHPQLLFQLQQNGIQVFGCEAESAAAALAQFRAGELEAAPLFNPEHAGGGCCGGHDHAADHECCGGANHGDDHECCGGKGHDNPDHECCGGKGHNHEHGAGGCGGQGRKSGGCGCSH
ncbi:hypothetical protein Q9Q94_07110 [Uliginosibacterium sp. 31-16]|uniref:hypothetical protein n=1 Tax=Uliginosibacterium sp. 31-16 TaxID=3068315 RepID=UPI00273D1B7F|nr:hypothetical protein [Uliginosibacterium sp. 31-16]MDP5239292.1 hypothetical protein [Uliginosibacterium sp. 31-16]